MPPRIVLQVSADLVTSNEKGEYGLRFPRMTRIRNERISWGSPNNLYGDPAKFHALPKFGPRA